MARMRFLGDAARCIDCNGCVAACHEAHSLPRGIDRRRVVTLDAGQPGERSLSVACMHCADAPCLAVCPTRCLYQAADGRVLHHQNLCIGCGYCLFACPFGAPRFPQADVFAARGSMDKCTRCAGAPAPHEAGERDAERAARSRAPDCVTACATGALLAGDPALAPAPGGAGDP